MTRRSQWSFKPEDLLHTPSSEDGFSLLRELELRAETCHIAFRVGLSIRPPGPASEDIHLILGGAATLLHRFFMRRSYSEFSPWVSSPTPSLLDRGAPRELIPASLPPYHLQRIAPVCLFIAAKDAERGMHVKQVARATLHRAAKNGLAPEVPHDDPVRPDRSFAGYDTTLTVVLGAQHMVRLCWSGRQIFWPWRSWCSKLSAGTSRRTYRITLSPSDCEAFCPASRGHPRSSCSLASRQGGPSSMTGESRSQFCRAFPSPVMLSHS